MYKEDIRIQKVIVHILDSLTGEPVLSDEEMEFGSDFAEFLREHIYRIASSDDCKKCKFYENESEVYKMVSQYQEEFFVDMSKDMANFLYAIMNSNIDIPPADFVLVQFKEREGTYLGLLKMNYKQYYTHTTITKSEEETAEICNDIILSRSLLPMASQKLSEAAIINLEDFSIQAIEKKYDVNGEKTNYFTYLFLKCSSEMSHKSRLSVVTKAVESVQNAFLEEEAQFEAHMRAKNIINQELEENGSFTPEEIAEKIFAEKPVMQEQFQEKIEKYNLAKQEIAPISENTIKKYQTQFLTTDSGIEIKIPMKEYNDPDSVEFLTNEDGSTSVLIKNIGFLKAKM